MSRSKTEIVALIKGTLKGVLFPWSHAFLCTLFCHNIEREGILLL